MKEYVKPFLTTFSIALFLYTMYTQNQKITELKTTLVKQNKLVDSLQTSLFEVQTMNGRYELTLEHLKETNKKAAQQFEEFMSSETE